MTDSISDSELVDLALETAIHELEWHDDIMDISVYETAHTVKREGGT